MWALLHRGFCIEVCAAFMSCVHTQQIFCFIIPVLQVYMCTPVQGLQVGKTNIFNIYINFIKKRIDGS